MRFRLGACAGIIFAAHVLSASAAEINETDIKVLGSDRVEIWGALALPGEATDGTARSRRLPLAILLHDFARDRDPLLPLADRLVEAGFAVLRVDMRGHGKSRVRDGRTIYSPQILNPSEFVRASSDIRILIASLRQDERLDLTRIALVGVGLSSFVVLEVAALEPDVGALVAVEPPVASDQYDSGRDLGIYDLRPALFIVSTLPHSQEQAANLARYGLGERIVHVIDTYDKGDALLAPAAPATEYVTEWLSQTLGSGAPPARQTAAAAD